MGMLSRRKGKVWEREVASRFRDIMPGVHIQRGLQSRGGTREVPDVDLPYFWIECKHGQLTNPRAALIQAHDAAQGTDRVPLAVCKDNRQPPFVAMYFEDFLKLAAEWWAKRSV